jgi:hypothetical protein
MPAFLFVFPYGTGRKKLIPFLQPFPLYPASYNLYDICIHFAVPAPAILAAHVRRPRIGKIVAGLPLRLPGMV